MDTDYVVDWLKGKEHAITLLQNLFNEQRVGRQNNATPIEISISIITFAEVYVGIYGAANMVRQQQMFLEFVGFLPVKQISRSVAKSYATIRNDLARRGMLIDQPDLFIAATAITHNLTLVTRNNKDFQRIPHLSLYPSESLKSA